MRNLAVKLTTGGAALTTFLASAVVVLAATGYSLFGGAEYVSPGNSSLRAVELVSNATETYSGVDYDVESGTTFGTLETLSTDFKVDEGTCAGGSPRFQINVTDPDTGDTGNIFVYIDCTVAGTGWQSTGDLLEAGKTVDATQVGGLFYQEYTTAVAQFGDYQVTGVQLVTDASWLVNQNFDFDNTNIDGTIYTYEPTRAESKEMCKDGGYATMTDPRTGDPFRNQGQCVSYYANPNN